MSDSEPIIKSPEFSSEIRPMITDLLGGYDNPASEWDQDDAPYVPPATETIKSN